MADPTAAGMIAPPLEDPVVYCKVEGHGENTLPGCLVAPWPLFQLSNIPTSNIAYFPTTLNPRPTTKWELEIYRKLSSY